MVKKRVLILHISKFGGHSRAAFNIKEALEYRQPDIEVLNINAFGYFYPNTEKVIDLLYTLTIKHFPSLWGKVYDRDSIVKFFSPPWQLLNYLSKNRFFCLIKEFEPQAIVATQAFPCGIAGYCKSFYKLTTPLVAVVTDYYPHRFWIHPEVNVYSLGCPMAKEILVKEGVKESKIKILGIPISIKFLTSYQRKEVGQMLGLSLQLPAVLIMGGGIGIGAMEEVALYIDRLDIELQIIVVCGKNKKLYKWFEKNKKKFRKPLFYFSYIDFVHKLMDFCDVIVTKPGGITTAEALSKNLAIIVVNFIPGQEERNVNYLLRRGAILKAKNVPEVGTIIKRILKNKSELFYLQEKAGENAVRDSSLKIADLVLKMIG